MGAVKLLRGAFRLSNVCCYVHREIDLDSGLGWSGACLEAPDTILQEWISGLLLTRSGGLF